MNSWRRSAPCRTQPDSHPQTNKHDDDEDAAHHHHDDDDELHLHLGHEPNSFSRFERTWRTSLARLPPTDTHLRLWTFLWRFSARIVVLMAATPWSHLYLPCKSSLFPLLKYILCSPKCHHKRALPALVPGNETDEETDE